MQKGDLTANNISYIDRDNLLKEERIDKIKKLKELLPNIINSDNILNVQALKDFLGAESTTSNNQGYELTFAGKGFAKAKADQKTNKELKVELKQSKNFDTTENVIIRGDNIDVLKILKQNYNEKIKMIYIDPPYNTGNDGFIYNDDFKTKEEELIEELGLNEDTINYLTNIYGTNKHSAWLSFMYPRLVLARQLLAKDGVIFISIDDNEQANLKLLCDEIFGEENFVTILHVEMSTTQGMKVGAAQNGNIVKNGEYVLIYSKDGHKNIAINLLYDIRKFDNHYTYFYDGKTYAKLKDVILKNDFLKNQIENSGLNNKTIEEWYNSNNNIKKFIFDNAEFIFQDGNCNISMSQDEINSINVNFPIEIQKDNKKYIIIKTSGKNIRQLIPLFTSIGYANDFYNSYGLRKIRGDFWKDYYLDMGNISKEGNVGFDNGKKPLRLLKDIIKLSTLSDDLVLDFFAGSGTTAHAVMDLNKEEMLKVVGGGGGRIF